ncbi:hypothetical protein MED121_23009 [Marinomonas sp. MED121]|uniref:helix-turn-helix domain-containing protein n=1 Tax=Marinomonas sp. MED121 TaxID=314277 RepID=UPI000069049F|nr:XRE family transcriptional regulator [Marinomonas sp. MED121]EAQ64669.1 hypothetical protein MED121_23009 [Marinomonas sp. MED121]
MTHENTLPIEIVAKALKRERRKLGVSMAEIARQAGIAKSTLSQLESGIGNPSLETLWALSIALQVPFSKLIEVSSSQVQLIRKGDGVKVSSEHADYTSLLLSACPASARRDIYQIMVQPGQARQSAPHMEGVIEHIIVTKGSALIGPNTQAETLYPGDYISYSADQEHIFDALEADTEAIIIMEQS